MINSIVIVGGGFAGWYTAAALRHNFPKIKLTVIDSDKRARLGVGETLGWSAPYDWKRLLGLKDDRMLMWRTGAIYKYGLTATDFWQDNKSHSYGKFFNLKVNSLSKFYGKFDYPEFYESWSKREGDIGIQQAWMAEAFFAYNKARNQYISQQQWPNYYEWLKKNRFNGKTSDEIFNHLCPQWAK